MPGLHEEKRALAKGVLEDADAAGKLSSEDLVDLIRFGEDAQLPEPSEPPRPALRPEPLAVELDHPGLQTLSASLEETVSAEASVGRLVRASARAYTRAFERLVAYAAAAGGRKTPAAWRDSYLSEIAEGTFEGSQSIRSALSVAVNRVYGLLDRN